MKFRITLHCIMDFLCGLSKTSKDHCVWTKAYSARGINKFICLFVFVPPAFEASYLCMVPSYGNHLVIHSTAEH